MMTLDTPRDRWPLFAPPDEAARYAGVSKEAMREWVADRVDPIPHMEVGVKRLVQVSEIEPYMDRRFVLRGRS